jgi:hypothetical protein
MTDQESIDCIVVAGRPVAFGWRDAMYEVARVVHAWPADEEWWNACYFADTQFWVVVTRRPAGVFTLRQDSEGGWWVLPDETPTAPEIAA